MRRKRLLCGFYVLAISLLLMTLSSCGGEENGGLEPVSLSERVEATEEAMDRARERERIAAHATETVQAATMIAEVETYEAAIGLALEITEMWTKVIKEHEEEFVADIDFYFTVRYATAGHTAFVVCYEEDVKSDETPVSGESGTSEVVVHLEKYDYYGVGESDPFCELRDASSGEVLAEAFPGPHTVYR